MRFDPTNPHKAPAPPPAPKRARGQQYIPPAPPPKTVATVVTSPPPALDWSAFGTEAPAKPANEIAVDFRPPAQAAPVPAHTPSWRRMSM